MKQLPKMPVPGLVKNAWQEELHAVIAWWESTMVDYENGGFYGRVDAYNRLHPQADKGVILNTRVLWSFSLMTRMYGRSSYQSLAERAYEYLATYFRDKDFGGVYWMLEAKGRVVSDRKQVYAQAFAIYSLAEFYRVTFDRSVLAWAREIFDLLDHHSRDPEHGGYLEAFSRDWSPISDLRLSNKDKNEAKTMNTHLHILEAYTNLYRVAPDPLVGDRVRDLIHIFLDKFIHQETGHLTLFFTEAWEPRSDEISYGHDIEASWLMCEAAEVLGDVELYEKCVDITRKIGFSTLNGQDEDGGIVNEGGPIGLTNTDKDWWPQFEAMVGWTNAWQVSGEPRFREAALEVWKFTRAHHKDPEHGEWHWCLNRDGTPNYKEDKAGPWKSPYHSIRALHEVSRRSTVTSKEEIRNAN